MHLRHVVLISLWRCPLATHPTQRRSQGVSQAGQLLAIFSSAGGDSTTWHTKHERLDDGRTDSHAAPGGFEHVN